MSQKKRTALNQPFILNEHNELDYLSTCNSGTKFVQCPFVGDGLDTDCDKNDANYSGELEASVRSVVLCTSSTHTNEPTGEDLCYGYFNGRD